MCVCVCVCACVVVFNLGRVMVDVGPPLSARCASFLKMLMMLMIVFFVFGILVFEILSPVRLWSVPLTRYILCRVSVCMPRAVRCPAVFIRVPPTTNHIKLQSCDVTA